MRRLFPAIAVAVMAAVLFTVSASAMDLVENELAAANDRPMFPQQWQPGPQGPGPMMQPGQEEMSKKDAKEFKDMMKSIMIWKMVQDLELTEEECYKIFPKISEMEKTMDEMNERIGELKKNLRDAVKDKKEDGMKKSIEELKKTEDSYTEKIRNIKASIESTLSVEKQAKFILFQDEFRRKLKENIGALKGGRPQQGLPQQGQPGFAPDQGKMRSGDRRDDGRGNGKGRQDMPLPPADR